MSALSSVQCPLCPDMMDEDYGRRAVFYHCSNCGYGAYFSAVGDDTYKKWATRSKFTKKVKITKKHGLVFRGWIAFEPMKIEFDDEYGVYPRSYRQRLVWKLYALNRRRKTNHLGTFESAGEAFRAGDRYADEKRKGKENTVSKKKNF